MNELSFHHPELWPWLLLAPLFWGLVFWLCQQRQKARQAYGALCLDDGPSPVGRASRLMLAGLLLFLTYMEPRYGEEKVKVERRGLDLIFCLDTSRSMLAEDVRPNRLEKAKRDIRAVLAELVGGDRVGLLAFAGDTRLVVPLTHDLDSFRYLLQEVSTDTVRTGGTDLAKALRRALDMVVEGDNSSSVIILLTDGEDLRGAGRQAAADAAEQDVIVHAVGYGSTAGSKILLQKNGSQSFLKNQQGDEVVSAMDSDGLRALARASGGEFLRADAYALPLLELKLKRLDPMLKKAYEAGEETVFQPRFQWTLLPALLLLGLELCWLGGRRR